LGDAAVSALAKDDRRLGGDMALITETNRRWWALGALSVSLFMIMLDNTVVSLALPTIQRDLDASLTQLEWVVNAYTLAFAVVLLTGGKVADLLGRRRIFVVGLVVFTASSLACGLAGSGGALISARAVQGLGAALMLPATLSIITATFAAKERAIAIGIWAAISGAALAIGPMIGGVLVQHAGWEWIFYINIPVGVIGILATFKLVDESRDRSAERRLDVPGLLTSAVGIFALNYALIQGNTYGWSSGRIVGSFVAAAVLLVAFLAFELRQRLPMLDLTLFRERTFTAANVNGLLMFIGLFTYILYFSIFLQTVLGYSAVQAGATFLVSSAAILLFAPAAGGIAAKVGPRLPMTGGMALYGVAMLVMSSLDETAGFWNIAPWLFVGGAGFGLIVAPMTEAILASVDVDKAGVASGVMQVFRQLGGSLGVAIMGAILAGQLHGLTPGAPSYRSDYVSAWQTMALVAGIISFVSAAIAFAAVRQHREAGALEGGAAVMGGGSQ
jgi:EmrB/QacA subfamily drug resistance transporter